MDLRNIRVDGRDGEEDSQLIEAIRRLPDSTIAGISGYGDVCASHKEVEDEWGLGVDKTAVRVRSIGHNGDKLILNLPRDSASSVKSLGSSFYFEYSGESYIVEPVNKFQVA